MNIQNNPKSIIRTVLVVLIILAVGYGINSALNKEESKQLSLKEIMALDEQQRLEALEKQVADLQRQSESADNSSKFSINIRLAEAQIALERYDNAISTLNSIPEEQKNNTRVPIAYARAYKGKGDIDLAKENLNRALTIDNELPEAMLLNIELNQDLPNDQLDALYRDAIVKSQSGLDIMISYARFSERVGNIDTAVAAWETAANANPEKESEYRAEISRLRQ